jgi:hypothetical protein
MPKISEFAPHRFVGQPVAAYVVHALKTAATLNA